MKRCLLHVFPAFGEGGPEVRTADIINNSRDRFVHKVISLSNIGSGRTRFADESAVAFTACTGSSLLSLAKTIRSQQADLVLTYGWGGTDAIAAARLAGVRRIVHAEDGFLDDEVDRQQWKRQWARRLVFKAAKSLVVPSLSLCEIARTTWRVGQGRLRYIPNGIDVERFQPPTLDRRVAARRFLSVPDDAIVVGIVGALRPEKNQSRLLQAFASIADVIPNSWLVIVGDGPEMASLRHAAASLAATNRVVFSGNVLDTTIYYQAMDLLAISSDTEQMPLSVLEGMASGLPIVSTDVGDVSAMVCEENRRWVVPCSERGRFTEALSTLLNDCQRRAELGDANRRKCVELYDSRRMLQAYIDLYEEFAVAN
jgi:glycosyltransferase involved in cell wall biosynthesis